MKMSQFTRNAQKVKSQLVVQDDGSVYSLKECKIYIPAAWENTPLTQLDAPDDGTRILGQFMLAVGNDYMVSNVGGMVSIGVTERCYIDIDGVECIEFTYQPGEIIMESLTIAADNILPYYQVELMVNKGIVVPYANYNDSINLLTTADSVSSLGGLPNYAYISSFIGHGWRHSKDKTLLARNAKPSEKIVKVPYRSVIHSTVGGLSMANGSYLDQGINKLLTTTNTEMSDSEAVLRK